MKYIHMGALIIAMLFPAALASGAVKDEAKDQETAETPDETQTDASETQQEEIDASTYGGQVRLISSVFEDLQTLVEINADSLTPEKSDAVIAEVRAKLVDILKRLPAYHKITDPTLKHIEQKDLQASASSLLLPLADLVGALPKSDANTQLIFAAKGKIDLLRKGF